MAPKRKLVKKNLKKKKMNTSNIEMDGDKDNRFVALEDSIENLIDENKRLKKENEVLKIKLTNGSDWVNNLIEKVKNSNECRINEEDDTSSELVQSGHCVII